MGINILSAERLVVIKTFVGLNNLRDLKKSKASSNLLNDEHTKGFGSTPLNKGTRIVK